MLKICQFRTNTIIFQVQNIRPKVALKLECSTIYEWWTIKVQSIHPLNIKGFIMKKQKMVLLKVLFSINCVKGITWQLLVLSREYIWPTCKSIMLPSIPKLILYFGKMIFSRPLGSNMASWTGCYKPTFLPSQEIKSISKNYAVKLMMPS